MIVRVGATVGIGTFHHSFVCMLSDNVEFLWDFFVQYKKVNIAEGHANKNILKIVDFLGLFWSNINK